MVHLSRCSSSSRVATRGALYVIPGDDLEGSTAMNTSLLQLAATQLGTKPEEEDRAPQEKKPRETVEVSSGEESGVGLA
ncbi:hypothetical protein MMC08_001229 [Hypocenomyce scalaris]|nr:hypothetical protein [Hypocenomyce scalaris]